MDEAATTLDPPNLGWGTWIDPKGGYTASVFNARTYERFEARAKTLIEAQGIAYGYRRDRVSNSDQRHCVLTVKGPKGGVWTYRRHEKRSGSSWKRD